MRYLGSYGFLRETARMDLPDDWWDTKKIGQCWQKWSSLQEELLCRVLQGLNWVANTCVVAYMNIIDLMLHKIICSAYMAPEFLLSICWWYASCAFSLIWHWHSLTWYEMIVPREQLIWLCVSSDVYKSLFSGCQSRGILPTYLFITYHLWIHICC